MKNREALAVLGVCAAIGGGFGAEISAHEQHSAREAATVAALCDNVYVDTGTDGSRIIGKDTLRCLNEGYVPGGRKLNPELSNGDPAELLDGYVRLEKSRGRHFDMSTPLLGGVLGLVAGLFLLEGGSDDKKKPRRKPTPAAIE